MYNIILTGYFKKQLKRLVKKDPHLKENLKKALLAFRRDTAISIGSGVYKIRIAGHGKGKSGGYRAYLFVMEIEGMLAPLCMYSKNEKDNLTYEELTSHLRTTKSELSKQVF